MENRTLVVNTGVVISILTPLFSSLRVNTGVVISIVSFFVFYYQKNSKNPFVILKQEQKKINKDILHIIYTLKTPGQSLTKKRDKLCRCKCCASIITQNGKRHSDQKQRNNVLLEFSFENKTTLPNRYSARTLKD